VHVIHYHGTPFSGSDFNHLALQGKHAMVSYRHRKHITTVAEVCQSFCLDNGAFSAWKSGTNFDPGEMIEWGKRWLKHPGCDFAVIPDVIDGKESDNDYWLKAVRLGDPQWTPVWHLHESLDRLVRLCSEWPRVALGSSGEYAEIGTRDWWDRICEAMDEITDDEGLPITKLHGLRMLDPGLSSYIPFASADSTNVARNIGIDVRWTGPYVPTTQRTRAMVIMDRIENHACASRWNKGWAIKQANFDLIG
jgi:hypothetical protein